MFHLQIKKREEPLVWSSSLVILAALGISLGVSCLMLLMQGKPPLTGMALLFEGAFGSRWALTDSLIKAIPIFLCSLGVAIAFRLRMWNIGAEGQFAFGVVGAGIPVIYLSWLPSWSLLPLMMISSFVLGGLWGFIPAILKLKMRANEIIVTLMLNYIAILFLDFLVYGPWKDPKSHGFPMTREFPGAAILGKIGESDLNYGLFICFFSGFLVWIFFKYTRLGFELMASGESVQAAKYAGLPYERLVMLVMVLSGAMAGWAGFVEASATVNRIQPSIMVGYGYTAIVVAWLARLNPLKIGVASFLLAGLKVGVENLQLDLQVPAAFGDIMEGLILVTVLAGGFFINYKFVRRRS